MRKYLSNLAGSLVLMFGLAAQANAAVVMVAYDEATDGDLANSLNSFSTQHLGVLSAGVYSVIGDVDAGAIGDTDDGPDEFDVFRFATTGDWTMSGILFSGTTLYGTLYELGTNGFYSYTGNSPTLSSDMFGILSAGEYALGVVPSQNGGTGAYEFQINVAAVPAPAAAWLFGSGLLGLIGVARRKKAA